MTLPASSAFPLALRRRLRVLGFRGPMEARKSIGIGTSWRQPLKLSLRAERVFRPAMLVRVP